MLNKISNNKNIITIILTIIIFTVVFSFNNIFYFINKAIQDEYYNIKNGILWWVANKNIIIVEIDEKTLETIWRHPFDRKVYADVIDKLTLRESAVIAFDILFLDKTNDIDDSVLANSLEKSWRVLLPVSKLKDKTIKKPLNIFLDKIDTIWFLTPIINKENKVVYSVEPEKTFDNELFNYFWVSILRKYYSYFYWQNYFKWDSYQNNFYALTPNIKIPLSQENSNEILINYVETSLFNKVSFIDIYDDEKFNKFDDDYFKDKIIIIWTAAKWIKDIFYTPNGIEYWLYIHANFINTVLNKNFLIYFNWYLETLLVLLVILISVYFNLSKSWYTLFFSNLSISILFLFIFPFLIIVYTSLVLNYITQLMLWLILSLTFSNIVKYIIENIHKQKLNKALSEYVSKEIAEEIVFWLWKINLDWEKKKITMFFSDIEWFTSISEKFSPEKLISFLRDYLKEMSNIIIQEKGFINKYEWDAIIAFWWIFSEISKPDDSHNACLSSLVQQNVLKKLNDKWEKQWMPTLRIRIGLHSWYAITWNIWAKWKKMDYTALWDNVNIASRLEWVNKYYGTYICVSEVIYNEQKNFFEFRYLDEIKVKWKNNSLKIYELLWLLWELSLKESNIINSFQNAIELYLNKDFKEARILFSKLVKLWDSPSVTYKKRCEDFISIPPDDNWDWVWTMENK